MGIFKNKMKNQINHKNT